MINNFITISAKIRGEVIDNAYTAQFVNGTFVVTCPVEGCVTTTVPNLLKNPNSDIANHCLKHCVFCLKSAQNAGVDTGKYVLRLLARTLTTMVEALATLFVERSPENLIPLIDMGADINEEEFGIIYKALTKVKIVLPPQTEDPILDILADVGYNGDWADSVSSDDQV